MARKAARCADDHECPLTTPTVHKGGPIFFPGASNVRINQLFAARVTDHAWCNAPVADTVRGGLITVFIQGNPAARINDKCDVGSITSGSPNVKLGEFAGGPLTPFQAQWLYDYLAAQKDIPFDFPNYGCEA